MSREAATATSGFENVPAVQVRTPLGYVSEALCRDTEAAMRIVLRSGVAVPLEAEIRRVALCRHKARNSSSNGIGDATNRFAKLTLDNLFILPLVRPGNLQRAAIRGIDQQSDVSFSHAEVSGPWRRNSEQLLKRRTRSHIDAPPSPLFQNPLIANINIDELPCPRKPHLGNQSDDGPIGVGEG